MNQVLDCTHIILRYQAPDLYLHHTDAVMLQTYIADQNEHSNIFIPSRSIN